MDCDAWGVGAWGDGAWGGFCGIVTIPPIGTISGMVAVEAVITASAAVAPIIQGETELTIPISGEVYVS